MITIPDEIKTALYEDSHYKNIRIHFPNGERSDICNDLIVKDTVSFTESLCSQDELKFGLCEASQFECEVVGVGNVKGASIEVFCEIECGPSVTGAVWRTDIQKYVYPISYGVFTVESCQREADMTHRKIEAYSYAVNRDASKNKLEHQKEKDTRQYASSYKPNAFLLSLLDAATKNFSDNVFEHTDIPTYTYTDTRGIWWYRGQSLNNKYRCEITLTFVRFSQTANQNDLYRLNFEYNKKVVDWIIKTAMEMAMRYEFNDYSSGPFEERHFTETVFYYQASDSDYPSYHLLCAEAPFVFYPWVANSLTPEVVYLPVKATKIQIIYENESEVKEELVLTDEEGTFKSNINVDKYTPRDAMLNMFTLPYYVRTDRYGFRYFTRPDVSSQQLLNDVLELTGYYGLISRSGSFELLNIKEQFGLTPADDLYPGAITPEGPNGGKLLPKDYQSCWYDDDYTKPWGAVSCQYKNTSNEDCIFILYIDGYNSSTDTDTYLTYEISNSNYFIQNNLWTQAQIQSICESIADNISGVRYMPVDFVGRGLPYVEAGDTFEILTRSSDSITTIVLNRTLTGEQTLTDSYRSV